MKKRRLAIVAFLLIAVMAIGIGFAELTDVLTISGSANVDADDTAETFDSDVYFSKAVASAERCNAVVDPADNDKATMTVVDRVLKEVGDEVIATFTVKSESDLPVYVTPSISNSNSEYFDVYTTWTNTQTIAPNSTSDIVVTVKLAKTAVADQATTFTITLNASTTAPTP